MITQTSTKQRIASWLKKFNHRFHVDKTAVDLRDMANNYPDGLIPVLDIADGIEAVIGSPRAARGSVDPQNAAKVPKFTYVKTTDTYINPIFQRDVAPNHVRNIEKHVDTRMILVPCAVKMIVDGKPRYCIWDGGHTVQLLIRQGWDHIPVWYTDVDDLSPDELVKAEEAMVGLAGRSFLCINKTFKRPVSGYDEFMIRLETRDVDAMKIMNILRANGCRPYRFKRQSGDVTHFEALWEAYNLQNASGIKGAYLARALAFHRKHWPAASIEAEVMRPMAMLYAMCDSELGQTPSSQFDDDLGDYLARRFGSAESVQESIKASYAGAHPNGRDSNPVQVTGGLLNIYQRHINKETVAVPEVRWDV